MAIPQFLWTDSSHINMISYNEGWIYFTYDDGALYIDCEQDGTQQRIRIASDLTSIKEYVDTAIANALPVHNILPVTQEEYDALTNPDDNTLYVIEV